MPIPLDGFFKKASETPPITPNLVPADFNQLHRNAFKSVIPTINQMDEHSLSVCIKNNIDIISEDILDGDIDYAPLLTDTRFISCFIRAVNSIPIEYITKLACNRITYDYFTSDNPNPEIKQQYLNMSKVVNRSAIMNLVAIGLDETTACNLALCRYSSANEKTNAKRLNFAIYPRDPGLMSEQMVIWIYEKLFERISDLFQAIMFETYSPQEFADFGDNFEENYGTIGLAILTILNNMTTENIRKVLIGYSVEWQYLGKPMPRFSLHTLSADYSRITRVIEYLSQEGKYLVP